MTIQQIIKELSKPGERSNDFSEGLFDILTPMSFKVLKSWQDINLDLCDTFSIYCEQQNEVIKDLISLELSDSGIKYRRDNNLQELTLNTEI